MKIALVFTTAVSSPSTQTDQTLTCQEIQSRGRIGQVGLTAGLFGAFFFRLTDINNPSTATNVDDAVLQRKWSYTLLRAGVGLCGALVVYIFLRSGIAEGALFPKFDEISIELVDVVARNSVAMSVAMPSKALALLMFWCFLAGYSEKLVPSILGSAEQKLTEAATSAEAR